MNTTSLIGRFTRKPDLRYSQSGNAVLNGNIAVQRPFKQDGEYKSDFPNILAFGKTAEIIAEHFDKGDMIGVTGRIQTDKYEKDGRTIYKTDVVVDNITFLPKKQQSKPDEPDPFENDGQPIDIDDGDLPF